MILENRPLHVIPKNQPLHVSDKIDFLPLTSQPNVHITWLLRLVFIPIFSIIPILVFLLPIIIVSESAYIFNGQVGEVIFLLVAYAILIFLFKLTYKFLKNSNQKSITKIEVNDKGIHYVHVNGATSAVLYEDITNSGDPYMGDVFSKSRFKGPTVLCVFLKDKQTNAASERIVSFDTDIISSQYTRNKKALIGHFIKGVKLFRPDLKVNEGVYINFYIDKATHAFDKKDFIKTIIFSTILVVIILFLINLYVQYRFPA